MVSRLLHRIHLHRTQAPGQSRHARSRTSTVHIQQESPNRWEEAHGDATPSSSYATAAGSEITSTTAAGITGDGTNDGGRCVYGRGMRDTKQPAAPLSLSLLSGLAFVWKMAQSVDSEGKHCRSVTKQNRWDVEQNRWRRCSSCISYLVRYLVLVSDDGVRRRYVTEEVSTRVPTYLRNSVVLTLV